MRKWFVHLVAIAAFAAFAGAAHAEPTKPNPKPAPPPCQTQSCDEMEPPIPPAPCKTQSCDEMEDPPKAVKGVPGSESQSLELEAELSKKPPKGGLLDGRRTMSPQGAAATGKVGAPDMPTPPPPPPPPAKTPDFY